ncbi:membrane protein [Brevundimonas sp. GN22]
MEIASILLVNVAVAALGFAIVWAVGTKLKDPTIVDAYWGLGMPVLALSTFLQVEQPTMRNWLLLGISAIWGVRLFGYMIRRWQTQGPDRRYERLYEKAKEKKGWSFGFFCAVSVCITQMPLQFLVSLPVQLGQIDAVPATVGIIGWIGAAIAIFGLIFECIADWQLSQFKKDASNKGKVMQSGLWRYSRHPNYFGEALVWWGLYMIAAESFTGLFSIFGPAFLTWTLMKWSGAPTMEYRMRKTKPEYADYIARTSGFIPMPPKKI